jgi:hypothetical protein
MSMEVDDKVSEFDLENDRKLLSGKLQLDDYELPDNTSDPVTPIRTHKRQLREIDIRQFEMLARIGCTWSELEEFYGVHASTLRKYLTENYRKGRADLKICLRRAQLNEAIKRGNPALLIFLGKNILGQSDAGEITQEEQASITFVTKMYRHEAKAIEAHEPPSEDVFNEVSIH